MYVEKGLDVFSCVTLPPWWALSSANMQDRSRLRSTLSQLVVRRTCLHSRWSVLPGCWISPLEHLPQHVTSASSLQVFKSRLKTHLFDSSFPRSLLYHAAEVALAIIDTSIVFIHTLALCFHTYISSMFVLFAFFKVLLQGRLRTFQALCYCCQSFFCVGDMFLHQLSVSS